MKNLTKNNSTINERYLQTITPLYKFNILNNIANHYGISVKEAEAEVVHHEAQNIYQYIANDKQLRIDVYSNFQSKL